METQGRYPAVKPLCLLLPSPGREFRSQREKKILCWSTGETEKGPEELSPWLSVARQVFVLWTDSPQLTNTQESLQLSLSGEELLLINLLGFATIDRGVRLLFLLYSIVLSACLIIVSVKSFFLGLCSSLLQRLQIIISVVYKASKGFKQLCVCLDQSRFSLGVAKLMLICLGFDFSLPASDYTFITVIIVTKESIRKWRSTCKDFFSFVQK